jgi:hypothetical protein
MESHFLLQLRTGAPLNKQYCVDISAQVQGVEMNLRTRAIIVNTGIAAGLLLMFYRGSGLLPVAISGVLLFTLANVLMLANRK